MLDMGMDSAEAAWPLEKLEKQPEGDHLSLWVALLSRSFPALSLRSFPPHVLEEMFSACQDKTSQKYLSLSLGLRDTVSQAQLTFFPVHCPQNDEHPDGHWVLLVFEPPHTVRYYETMDQANEVCFSRVEQLLEALGISPGLVSAVPERSNKFRQVGEDCGWWVLHYTEAFPRPLRS